MLVGLRDRFHERLHNLRDPVRLGLDEALHISVVAREHLLGVQLVFCAELLKISAHRRLPSALPAPLRVRLHPKSATSSHSLGTTGGGVSDCGANNGSSVTVPSSLACPRDARLGA